jgi:branched-chain amino acid aminotransferase
MQEAKLIYMNGEFVPFADAKVHILAPVTKYGALVFEGICAYWNARKAQSYVFRNREHLARLRDSMRIMRFEGSYDLAKLDEIVRRTVEVNDLRCDVHIRLAAWIDGDGEMDSSGPVSLACVALPRPERTLEGRLRTATVSNWRRIDDRSMPPRVKTAANYSNSRLALMQARADGYEEALLLGTDGKVSEGTAACFFMVRNGVVVTPPVTSGILESVTRQTLLDLLRDHLHVPVQERVIDRTEVYVADEAFLCGSAYEITPLKSVDRIAIAEGGIGPLTRTLWDAYQAHVRGEAGDNLGWLTPVFGAKAVAA